MISNDWKVLILAPLAASLLVGCQSKSDDNAASAPSSPYQGFWVNQRQVELCRSGKPRGELDAIFIQGDGQVIRYSDRESFANGDTRVMMRLGQVRNDGAFARSSSSSNAFAAYGGRYDIGYGMRDGRFEDLNGNQMKLREVGNREHYRLYARTTETQLQRYQAECNPRFAQVQPPDGGYTPPSNVDPRLVTPNQGAPQKPAGNGEYPPPPPEMYQPDRRNEPWIQEPAPPRGNGQPDYNHLHPEQMRPPY